MARTGLRMMPTSPSPPLKFRTAGFPQYGFKASMSDRAFLQVRNLKPAPGMQLLPRRLLLSFARFHFRGSPGSVSRSIQASTCRCSGGLPSLPQGGPWLRSELCCLGPSSLTTTPCVSLAGTLRLHVFALIRSAFAVRERLGDPRDLPYFRYRAFPACRRPYPGGPPCPPVIPHTMIPGFLELLPSRLTTIPSLPAISDGEPDFGAASFTLCYGLQVCLALLAGYDKMKSYVLHHAI